MSKINNLEEYITEAIQNIRSDRALIMSLLTELMVMTTGTNLLVSLPQSM